MASSSDLSLKVLSSGKLRVACLDSGTSGSVRVRLPHDCKAPDGFFRQWQWESAGESGSVRESWNLARDQVSLELDPPLSILPFALDLFTGEEAPVIGSRLLTGTALDAPFPPIDLRLATTRGTNALLENKIAPVALFITAGFRDLLTIRDQRRPNLFALHHDRPPPLFAAAVEVEERLDASGSVLRSLTIDDDFRARCRRLIDDGITVAAVALLHSYKNPVHEETLARFLSEIGFDQISLSSHLAPFAKILPRAETAVVDAALTRVMEDFLDDVTSVTPRLQVMTSAGGLELREHFRPKDSLFSGPAGGVVGAAAVGRRCGYRQLITFDMGGTSTDVARYDDGFVYQFSQRAGNATLLAPALRIETVAAGGGSICQWTGNGLRVGPESAGADPGPACYGRGGPLTVTDVNLLLGRIEPENFGLPIGPDNLAAARSALEDLMRAAGASDEEAFLMGLLEIAVEQMADSIRTISVREGVDPAAYTLLTYGGAGPLHACDIAERLGMTSILVPKEAGLLSAFGLHQAVTEKFAERQVLAPLGSGTGLEGWLAELEREAGAKLTGQGPLETRRRLAEVRFAGQESTLTLDLEGDATPASLESAFRSRYEQLYGYWPDPSPQLELVALRVVVATEPPALEPSRETGSAPLPGPRVLQDAFSTLYLKEGWEAITLDSGDRLIRRPPRATRGDIQSEAGEAVRAELFRHRFQQIVTEMGARLQRSAISTNVKERLDYSCALLDGEGRLVVNAPHVPVHLGALGLCVRRMAETGALDGSATAVTNHPAFGGSHLPDVTLVTPVRTSAGLVGYIANRAHHAEIGGSRPGSMPPGAKTLAEEGVVIPPMPFEKVIADDGALFRHAPFPSRAVSDNLADLHAQAAANRWGAEALASLAAEHGLNVVREQFSLLRNRARESIRSTLQNHPPSTKPALQRLDDGTPIAIAARVADGRLTLDFTGSGEMHPGNLNATPAIVRSAVLYALRLWSQSDLPLNEGLLEDIDLHLPAGFLNPEFPANPASCPAVVGGNVETSQRLVDTLLALWRMQACSQGTMNNVIFGNERFGHYETIGGGAGAGPDHPGASGLHTHMTNTAITDVEILELRFPVRLHQFSLREGSGGDGRFRGGDGLIRDYEFTEALDLSLLTQHRIEAPYGCEGGEPGRPGRQVLTSQGKAQILPHLAAVRVKAGDRLRLETPGGGGWGSPPSGIA